MPGLQQALSSFELRATHPRRAGSGASRSVITPESDVSPRARAAKNSHRGFRVVPNYLDIGRRLLTTRKRPGNHAALAEPALDARDQNKGGISELAPPDLSVPDWVRGPDARIAQNYGYATPGQSCDAETGVCHPQILLLIPEGDIERAWAGASNALFRALQGIRKWFRPKISNEAAKSIRSLEQRLSEHQRKLDAFKEAPDAFDNKEFLKNAPSQEIRERIINGRINHLEQEIRNFQQQIERLRGPDK